MLVSAVTRTGDMRVTGAVDHPDTSAQCVDAGELAGAGRLGVPIVGNIAEMADFDVLVDFSVATATLDKLDFCRDNGKALVIGTTGFEAAGLEAIRRAADSVPIVMAPNMSVGVNVAFKLIELAARALGNDVDVEVFEAHHRHKIDAPSGTAVRMGEILADTLNRDIATDAVYGREGITGEREGRTIGFHSLRGGDIVGEHTVNLRRHRRAHRDHPPRRQPRELCCGSGASRAVRHGTDARLVRDGRCTGAFLVSGYTDCLHCWLEIGRIAS